MYVTSFFFTLRLHRYIFSFIVQMPHLCFVQYPRWARPAAELDDHHAVGVAGIDGAALRLGSSHVLGSGPYCGWTKSNSHHEMKPWLPAVF